MINKNFDEWNIVKKKTEEKINRPKIKVGDVYWCRLGLNIGNEFDGKNNNFIRPVLVVKKFTSELVFVVPLTTKLHKGDWYFDIKIKDKDVQAILNQSRPIDVKRFENFILNISEDKITKILDAFKNLF